MSAIWVHNQKWAQLKKECNLSAHFLNWAQIECIYEKWALLVHNQKWVQYECVFKNENIWVHILIESAILKNQFK